MTTTAPDITLEHLRHLQSVLPEHIAAAAPWPASRSEATGRAVLAWYAAHGAVNHMLAGLARATCNADEWAGVCEASARRCYAAAGFIATAAAHANDAADAVALALFDAPAGADPTLTALDTITVVLGEAVAEQAAAKLAGDYETGSWESGIHLLTETYNVDIAAAVTAAKRTAGIGW